MARPRPARVGVVTRSNKFSEDHRQTDTLIKILGLISILDRRQFFIVGYIRPSRYRSTESRVTAMAIFLESGNRHTCGRDLSLTHYQ